MNILDAIEIFGLWGNQQKPIKIKFDESFNFLIGQNGTGKTTVINLLAAALEANFERLDKTDFKKIVITLKSLNSRKKPRIEIEKTQKGNLPYFDINYTIFESRTSEGISFDLDAIAEEKHYRGIPPRAFRERYFRDKFVDVQKNLESIIKVCWLSVNRDREEHNEERGGSSVDKKLKSIQVQLGQYFSTLTSQFSQETKEFQKKSFLSLLTSDEENVIKAFSQNIDIDDEKKALANVFETLGMSKNEYEKKLNTHLAKFQHAKEVFSKEKQFSIVQFSAIYNAWKSHSLVNYYETLTTKKSTIFHPVENFIEVVNSLLKPRKRIEISERNEIVILTKDERIISLEELSSGEKQLLIILGEALLQREENVVYIADEPELSLHVIWQELLTDSIHKLNPNSQIIFATHSPDIVSNHSDKVIDMETLV